MIKLLQKRKKSAVAENLEIASITEVIGVKKFQSKPVLEGENHIPLPVYNVTHDGSLLLSKLDHHLQCKITVVPIVKGDFTWDILAAHNTSFAEMIRDVVELTNRPIRKDVLDQIAQRVKKRVTDDHIPIEQEEQVIV